MFVLDSEGVLFFKLFCKLLNKWISLKSHVRFEFFSRFISLKFSKNLNRHSFIIDIYFCFLVLELEVKMIDLQRMYDLVDRFV